MPDFTNYSHFDANAAFSSVKYGSNALVLEVELNETQNILDNKVKTLILDRFGNGFYKTGTLTYATGSVTLAIEKAFANGNIVYISSLVLALAEGESAYLDVWEQELVYTDTIKKFGNQQEVLTLTNYIKDIRVTEETTKRTQVQYNIVKTTGVSGHTYLPICTITAGLLVDNRVAVGSTGGGGGSGSVTKLYSSFTSVAPGTSVCLINQPDYVKATDVLDVFYQGAKLTPDVHYTVAGNGLSITLNGFTITTSEVIRFEVLKNMAVDASTGGIAYYENNVTLGSASAIVNVGISQYNPTNDLLFAYVNTTYLKKGVDFTVTGTGATAAINKPTGTWAIGSEFDFTVVKNVIVNASQDIQDQLTAMQAQIDATVTQTDVSADNIKKIRWGSIPT